MSYKRALFRYIWCQSKISSSYDERTVTKNIEFERRSTISQPIRPGTTDYKLVGLNREPQRRKKHKCRRV